MKISATLGFLLWLWPLMSVEPSPVTPAELRAARAESIHETALEYAMKEQYNMAAAYFRTACRLSPRNVRYLNDLGVTEMRMEKYGLALKRLAAASTEDPTYEYTQKNIVELRRYVSDREFDRAMREAGGELSLPQLHSLQCPRLYTPLHPSFEGQHWYSARDLDHTQMLSMAELKSIYFNEQDRHTNKKLFSAPFVIRKAAQSWGWNLAALSSRALAEKFGTLNTDFYPHNMGLETVHPLMSSLAYALQQIQFPDAVFHDVDVFSGGATYLQWNIDEASWVELLSSVNASLPSLLDDRYWMNLCFPDIRTRNLFSQKSHWRMVLIGNENAGMFNHQDTLSTASWQMQLKGKKKWHICAPAEAEHLYRPGEVDCFNPDYESLPKMKNATCFQTVLTPGDFIYYPAGYWHQTKNLSPLTVSITETMIGVNNHAQVAHELKNECNGVSNGGRKIFLPDPSMCSALDKCYQHWENIYTTDAHHRGSYSEL